LDNHLIPAAKACKTHNLKAVKKYSVRLPAITTHESYSNTKLLPGTYVFLKDLSNLEKRDAKAEFSNRKSRKATLEATYGPLPAGLTGLKDDEIAKYFTVKKEVELGHFVPLQDRCELFPIYSKRFIFISWLKSIGSILECPLTKTEYIKDYKTMDDLAELPGFIKTLLSYLENKAFSLQILSSRKVHLQAIAELI
jgi:hypothetical protein